MRYERVKLPSGKQWEAMSPAQREREQDQRGDEDPSDPQEVAVAEGFINYLGDKGCSKALPLIARLYAEHPSENIRIATGHALIALGDAASLDLMVSLGDEGEEWRRWFGTKARIVEDPVRAFDAFGGEDLLTSARGEEAALRALDVLELDAEQAKKAKRKPWILQDPRWLDVAAYWMLRGKEPAGYVFRHLPAERKTSALARARTRAKGASKGKSVVSKPGAKKGR
ncbi:MAG: HEAT repeat domain-containing protein [Polyangiaceae bacterium]